LSEERLKEEIEKAKKQDLSDLLPVYPGFLFKEFLVALLCLLALAWLGLLVEAPLDVPSDPDFTPNPSKAPWYFLGIQELFVYFDPWFAGVVIPSLIILSLILIPLLDDNPNRAGSYTFKSRIWATLPFTCGLLILVFLTAIGAWFRGSNWDWYWPWEDWAMAKPARPGFRSLPLWLGLSLLSLYYLVGLFLPFTLWRSRLERWGRTRYFIYFFLVLTMLGVAIKILLRRIVNIRYLLQTPWFNI
jgi:hypothetical protein